MAARPLNSFLVWIPLNSREESFNPTHQPAEVYVCVCLLPDLWTRASRELLVPHLHCCFASTVLLPHCTWPHPPPHDTTPHPTSASPATEHCCPSQHPPPPHSLHPLHQHPTHCASIRHKSAPHVFNAAILLVHRWISRKWRSGRSA